MSPHERQNLQQASPQPAPVPKTENDGAGFGWPHYHRPRHAEMELDPTARMEWLDDLMFAAIDGDPVALDCAAEAWRKTQDELGHSVLEESRHQYLRRAQAVWQALRNEPNHPPHKVFAAIEIISLLAGRSH